jgi:hypothetical protein
MRRSTSSHTRLSAGICSLIAALSQGTAQVAAADGGADCSAVYEAGLEQERAGHLSDATAIYQSCAADSCGNPTRQSCQAKLFRLELDMPSVVPLAQDSEGAPVLDVQVTMDGAPLASRLDGRAFRVDPGLHEFVFSAGGEEVSSQQLVIASGQRNREIWLELPPASSPVMEFEAEPLPPAPAKAAQPTLAALHTEAQLAPRVALTSSDQPESHSSLAPYILGGGALLGAGAYLVLSSWARGDNAKLSQCSPNCSPDSITHIRTLYVAADISLGVAAAAALTSVAWFVFSDSDSNDERAPKGGYALSIQPERDGALATLKGTL